MNVLRQSEYLKKNLGPFKRNVIYGRDFPLLSLSCNLPSKVNLKNSQIEFGENHL